MSCFSNSIGREQFYLLQQLLVIEVKIFGGAHFIATISLESSLPNCKRLVYKEYNVYSVHCIEPIKGPVHTHQFLFENGYFFPSCLAYCPNVSGENGYRKRMFSKTLSRVEIFGNAGFSFTRGWTKTEVFSCDDLCSERDAIVFNIFLAFSCGQAKMIR